jgi:fermentation-respiration switch protein FrsA (DUF1100 family)
MTMKKILSATAIVAFGTTAASANIVGPDMSITLNATNLATSCSFAGPLTGSMDYDEPNGQFVGTGTPATMDITYRSLSTITVTNDGVFDGELGAITAIDYGASTFGTTAITDNGNLTGTFSLVSDGALTIDTLTIDPDTIDVAVTEIQDIGAYPIAFTVTCLE